jgi:hypothetical protein
MVGVMVAEVAVVSEATWSKCRFFGLIDVIASEGIEENKMIIVVAVRDGTTMFVLFVREARVVCDKRTSGGSGEGSILIIGMHPGLLNRWLWLHYFGNYVRHHSPA